MAVAGFGFWAEQNTRIGRLLTGIIVAMAVTMLLSNLKVIPFQAPVYDTIFSRILPLSIPLLLFRADLRRALRTGGPTIWAFGIGSAGVVLGGSASMDAVAEQSFRNERRLIPLVVK